MKLESARELKANLGARVLDRMAVSLEEAGEYGIPAGNLNKVGDRPSSIALGVAPSRGARGTGWRSDPA